jgi:hypothetical protein
VSVAASRLRKRIVAATTEPKGRSARVILVGGAPLSGKTLAARSIGRLLGRTVISTDHLGDAARAVTKPTSHPELHTCHSVDYREYYTSYSPEQLLEHALRTHRALWPAIEAVIRRHLEWAEAAVIEGWALLPDLVAAIRSPGLRSVWIETPEPVLRARLEQDLGFARGAPDPVLLIDRFVARSVSMSSWLRDHASVHRLPYVVLSGIESPDQVSRLCLEVMDIDPAAG